jgi:hypothetical protein
MKQFVDEQGRQWVATAAKEDTPRHHGKWYMIFHPADDPQTQLPVPEIRWQTAATAARTIRTMADFELRRRLKSALERYAHA